MHSTVAVSSACSFTRDAGLHWSTAGLFDRTSDHSILAGARTASLGGTQLSQTAQPGITAATTALAVEHNSRCAASWILPQPSPHFPAIRNSISPASIVEVQLRFSTCGRKRVHVI